MLGYMGKGEGWSGKSGFLGAAGVPDQRSVVFAADFLRIFPKIGISKRIGGSWDPASKKMPGRYRPGQVFSDDRG